MLTVQCTAIFISEERMTNDHDNLRKCKNASSFKEEHQEVNFKIESSDLAVKAAVTSQSKLLLEDSVQRWL